MDARTCAISTAFPSAQMRTITSWSRRRQGIWVDGWTDGGGAEAGQLRMGLDWRGDPRRCLLWVSGQWRARVVPGGGCPIRRGRDDGPLLRLWVPSTHGLWVFPPSKQRGDVLRGMEAWNGKKGTGKGNGKEEGKREWEWEKEEDTVFRNTRPTLYVCFLVFFSHHSYCLVLACFPFCNLWRTHFFPLLISPTRHSMSARGANLGTPSESLRSVRPIAALRLAGGL